MSNKKSKQLIIDRQKALAFGVKYIKALQTRPQLPPIEDLADIFGIEKRRFYEVIQKERENESS